MADDDDDGDGDDDDDDDDDGDDDDGDVDSLPRINFGRPLAAHGGAQEGQCRVPAARMC